MTNDESPPAVEHAPPYSLEFVAHLHGGCYSADITPQLIAGVKADEAGRRLLDQLTIVQLELWLAASPTPPHPT